MQQVFIRLWEKRESIDESVDLDGYLFIITRNMIFNRPAALSMKRLTKRRWRPLEATRILWMPPLSSRLSEANGDVPTGYTKIPSFMYNLSSNQF